VFLVKIPDLLKPLASDLIWNFDRSERTIYLTFDDGPTGGITDEILEILASHQARATFFCIGGNVNRYPDIFAKMIDAGHAVGNHTWNHMNGWKFSDFSYYRSVLECAGLVKSDLFRPPYGRVTRSQVQGLKSKFRIVMWDVLSADWRADVSPQKCFDNVQNNVTSGSIVVFHDSEKARKNMLYTLPRALEFWSKQGYKFQAIV
jgi:peptidoglycan/xylan/chitin deacetylase (PgdA/CDA1 family)